MNIHLVGGAKSGRRAVRASAVVVVASMGVGPEVALAQFSRYVDDSNFKQLDLHPRGSLIRDAEIYGVLDLGVAFVKNGSAPAPTCSDLSPRRASSAAVGGLSSSLLGLRMVETLDRGWRAHATLEQGIDADRGQAGNGCGAIWDRRASVGMSHRWFGRLDLGRVDQPAWGIALLSDPWNGGSVASPGDTLYYRKPRGPDATSRQRSSDSITYGSPGLSGWTFELQRKLHASSNNEALQDPEAPRAELADEWGAALRYRGGAWQFGAGWQRWDSRNNALPVSAVYTFGHWRGYLGLTSGRNDGTSYRNAFIGATLQQRGGPHPGTLRFGLDSHRADGERSQWKLGAGYLYSLSRRTSLQMNMALIAEGSGASRPRFDAGIRHAFTL